MLMQADCLPLVN